MNAQTRKFPVFFIAISLALLAMVTSACSYRTPLLGEISQEVDIRLDQDLFSHSAPTFKIHDHDFWEDLDVDVNQLELHDGFLRFLGTRSMPDGSRADCTIDVSMGAENGMLTARIIALDIPGTQVTDPKITRINQEMEVLVSLDDYSDSEVLFKEVEVTEDALRLKVQVNIRF